MPLYLPGTISRFDRIIMYFSIFRLLSGFSDTLDDLFENANTYFNADQFMSSIDALDVPLDSTPELPFGSDQTKKCYECGFVCELLDNKWR